MESDKVIGKGFSRKAKILGLILLVLVIAAKVILLIYAQGQGWFLSHRTYLVKFKEGYNLHQGSLVKMFNTDIGKVSRMRIVRLMDEPQVEVTIKVLSEYADLIRQNSVAEVVRSSATEREYLEISPGSPGYAWIPEYGIIPSRGLRIMAPGQ